MNECVYQVLVNDARDIFEYKQKIVKILLRKCKVLWQESMALFGRIVVFCGNIGLFAQIQVSFAEMCKLMNVCVADLCERCSRHL